MPIDAFFLPVADGGGQRYCIHHQVDGTAQSAVVYVHPFAEEMNKSRRMAALQARAMAAAGHAVLQIDLKGCGDSSGDFGDATWDDWLDDVLLGCRWMHQRYAAPTVLWGLRAGCLLASQAAQRLDETTRLLLWQPVASGKSVLQQFLRLKVAGEMASGQASGVMGSLKARLAAGEWVEVAGYRVHPELAAGLSNATISPNARPCRIDWLEVSPRDDAAVSPGSLTVIDSLRRAGSLVTPRVVRDRAFWQSTEIEEAPALLSATSAAFAAEVPG